MSDPVTARTFSDWLADYGRGALDDELAATLAEVTTAVQAEGKAGTVTLKLKISPHKAGALVVDADIEAKPPKGPGRSAIFYYDPRTHSLTLRDPRQPQIPGTEDTTKESNTNG